MSPAVQPHAFETRHPGDPYCLVCNLPPSNQIHRSSTRRTRAVLVLDVPMDMDDEQVARRLTLALELEPRIVLQDLQVIL